MDDIIQKLINIENHAQSVVKDAKELEVNFDKVVSDSVTDIKKDIEKRVEKRVECIEGFERTDADKRIEELNSTVSAEKEKLLQKEKDNHAQWVDKIFNEIVSI
jgi:DNA anti-recombination protein RmuC